MRRSRLWIVTPILALLSGCGGGKGAAPNGAASKTPAQILAVTSAALGGVHSFHLQGTETDQTGLVGLRGDVSLPGKLRLSFTQGGATVEIVVVGSTGYILANASFWSTIGNVPPSAVGLLSGRWVKTPAKSTLGIGVYTAIADPATIGHCLVASHLGTVIAGGESKVDGQPAVVLIDRGDQPGSTPGRLYVATSGRPLPLRIAETGPRRPGGKPDPVCKETDTASDTTSTEITFSAYDKPVTITAPPRALDLSRLGRAPAQPGHAPAQPAA